MNDITAPTRIGREFVGGSDIGKLLGVSPFGSPYDVALEFTGQNEPIAPDPERTKRLRRGQLLEPVVLKMLQEEYYIEVVSTNARATSLIDGVPLSAQLDFVWKTYADPRPRNGEIKTSAFRQEGWGEPGTDEVPAWIAAQTIWGCGLSGQSSCDIAVLFGVDDLQVYSVPGNQRIFDSMVDVAVTFWKNLEQGIMPAPRTEADYKKLFPKAVKRTLQATDGILSMLKSYVAFGERIDTYDTARAACRLELLDYFRDADTLVKGDVTLATFKNQPTSSIDTEKLAKDFPEADAACRRIGSTRVLRPVKKALDD